MKQVTSFFLFFCIAIGLPFNATFAQSVRGNGDVVEEDRGLSDFHEIHAENGIDVHIRQGNEESVVVKADDNLKKYIRTDVENGKLMLYCDRVSIRHSKAFDVYVTVQDLTKIKARQGSDIYGLSEIRMDKLKLDLSSGSDLKMEIYADILQCELSGGSDVKISGKVKEFYADARGGSDIMAKKLETIKCEVYARGGSDAYVRVEEELNAQAFGASDIHYYGDPQLVHTKAKGGSDIESN